MKKIAPLTLLFVLIFAINVLFAQKSVHPGIDLYLAGKNAEALVSLSRAVKQKEFEANGEVWNYLGLAYIKNIDYKNAKKALEKAVKLTPENSVYHSNLAYVYILSRQTSKASSESKKAIELDPQNITAYYVRGSASVWELKLDDADKDADQIMTIGPTYPQGYLLKSNILVVKLGQHIAKGSTVRDQISFLKDATDVLRSGMEKCKNHPNHKLVDEEFESVETFYKYFSKDKSSSITTNAAEPEPGVTPIKILSKPRPSYTNSARQANVQGTIKLAVLFGANGMVQHTLILNRLGNGLDEEAIYAARKIQFEPMMKDGKPVSVVKLVEYSFSIF